MTNLRELGLNFARFSDAGLDAFAAACQSRRAWIWSTPGLARLL